MAAADELIDELDQALAALRRVIVRAIEAGRPGAAPVPHSAATVRAPAPAGHSPPPPDRATPAPVPATRPEQGKAIAPVAVKPQPKPPAPPHERQLKAYALAPVDTGAVRVTPEIRTIEFNGRSAELTARQINVCAVLARAMPQPVGREFIGQKAFPDLAQSSQAVLLSQMREPLTIALSKLGLRLLAIAGVGWALKVDS